MGAGSIAVVFPGQGSQKLGMMTEYLNHYPETQHYFNQAAKVLDYDLLELIQSGPEEKLNQTLYTQPAMLVADVVVWSCWRARNKESVDWLAGHSLGEYAALVAANSLEFEAAVELVAKRAEFMQAAVAEGEGAMAALLGLPVDKVGELCESASEVGNVVSAANLNAPGQVVVAGHQAAVERAIDLAKQAGAKRAIKLAVSVPSHCSLMQPAAEQLADELAHVDLVMPDTPVVHNSSVGVASSVDEIKQALVEQLYQPVRWIETIDFFAAQSITQVLECGPGKVLTSMNKRIVKGLDYVALSNLLASAG